MSEPKRRTCGKCWWFDGGICLVDPPTVVPGGSDSGVTWWPEVDEDNGCSRHWPASGEWGDPLRKDPVSLALVADASAVIDAAKAYRDDPGTVTEGKLIDCLRALDERTEG